MQFKHLYLTKYSTKKYMPIENMKATEPTGEKILHIKPAFSYCNAQIYPFWVTFAETKYSNSACNI